MIAPNACGGKGFTAARFAAAEPGEKAITRSLNGS